jgi:signal transduction histidine kinase
MQIRTRLTLLFTLNAAAVLAAVLVYVWWAYKQQNEEDFYKNLESKAAITGYTALVDPEQFRPLPVTWVRPDGDTLPYRDNVSLYNAAYERVFTLRTEAPPISIKNLQNIEAAGNFRFRNKNLHGFGTSIIGNQGIPFMVVTEGYCDPGGAQELAQILAVSFLFGLAAFAALGWYFAGQALAPVSQIMNEVDALRPNNLNKRIKTGKGKDELSRLASTFNRLLDRVEHAFHMQRMFLSNVSHELRNPLTAVRTQIDVSLQRQRSAEEYRAALQSSLSDLREISEVEEKLLLLAKVHNEPGAIQLGPIRLDELLWQAREACLRRVADSKVQIEFQSLPEEEDELVVNGNEALMRTAITNLLENGCKYSTNNQVVLRLLCKPNKAHRIEVANDGPAIPEAEQKLIFEPFYRSPRHLRLKGAGIGLSLVQSILDVHEVHLQVQSSEEAGTVFQLDFPKI